MTERPSLEMDFPPARQKRRARWPYVLALFLFLLMAALVGYFR
jgi:hypothetical protein